MGGNIEIPKIKLFTMIIWPVVDKNNLRTRERGADRHGEMVRIIAIIIRLVIFI